MSICSAAISAISRMCDSASRSKITFSLPFFSPAFQLRMERSVWSLSLSQACSAMISSNGFMSFICEYLGCRWFRVRDHTTLASVHFKPRISSLHVFASGIRQGSWSPCGLFLVFPCFIRRARLSGRQPQVLSLSISFGRSSSSSDLVSFPIHCHISHHFLFHWLPFHHHRDMENETERERGKNELCLLSSKKKTAKTTDQCAVTKKRPRKPSFVHWKKES